MGSRPVVGLWRGYKELLQLLAELLELLLGEASAYLGRWSGILSILVVDRPAERRHTLQSACPCNNMGSS